MLCSVPKTRKHSYLKTTRVSRVGVESPLMQAQSAKDLFEIKFLDL